MKIQFNKIRWKNILSYPNVFSDIVLDSHKTNLIFGKNGSGKSTILEILSFAFFNKSFRPDVNKPELLNDINNKELVVEVFFIIGNKNYLIRRGIKPNIFEIYEDNILINPKSDSSDYQEILEKRIIKCNYRSFLQTVILGSGNYTPFMKLTGPQRRDVIEDLLGLKVFSAMQVNMKQHMSEIIIQISDIQKETELTEKKIELIIENKKIQKEYNKKLVDEKEKIIQELNAEIDKSNNFIEEKRVELKKYDSIVADKKKYINSNIKYMATQSELTIKKNNILNEIKFLKEHENCPTCKQKIDIDFRNETIEERGNKLVSINDAIVKISDSILSIGKKLNDIENMEKIYLNLINEMKQKEFHINEWKKQISSVYNEIEILSNKSNENMDENIKELEDKLTSLCKEYNKLDDEKVQYSIAIGLLPYIKASVIKKYIPLFNKNILFYLHKFESRIRFILNEHFEETLINNGKDKLGYGSLSEGEKTRVNLAILFAWRAVAKHRGSVNCNLLFLDEILDSSLDAEGVDNFMRIIKEIDDGTCIYVISHKDGDFVDSFDRMIEVKKPNHFSQIIIH